MGSISILCLFCADKIICLASSTSHNPYLTNTHVLVHRPLHVRSFSISPAPQQINSLLDWRQVNSVDDQEKFLLQKKLFSSMNSCLLPRCPLDPARPSAKGLWIPSKIIISENIWNQFQFFPESSFSLREKILLWTMQLMARRSSGMREMSMPTSPERSSLPGPGSISCPSGATETRGSERHFL